MLALKRAGFELLEAMVCLPFVLLLFTIIVGTLFSAARHMRREDTAEHCRRLASEALQSLRYPPRPGPLTPLTDLGVTYQRELKVLAEPWGCYRIEVTVSGQDRHWTAVRRMRAPL